MATSPAPTHTYSVFDGHPSELRALIGEMTVGTLWNDSGRIMRITFSRDDVSFLKDDDTPFLIITGVDVRHNDGISILWSALLALNVSYETFSKIRKTASGEGDRYLISIERDFHQRGWLARAIGETLLGVNTQRPTWK